MNEFDSESEKTGRKNGRISDSSSENEEAKDEQEEKLRDIIDLEVKR